MFRNHSSNIFKKIPKIPKITNKPPKEPNEFIKDVLSAKYFSRRCLGFLCDVAPEWIDRCKTDYTGCNVSELPDNGILFLNYQGIDWFLDTQIHMVNNKFTVLYDSEDTDMRTHPRINLLLDCQFVHKIFATNCSIKHPKINLIGIGIDYHTLCYIPFWGKQITSILDQERNLLDIKSSFKDIKDTEPLAICNFQHNFSHANRKKLFNVVKGNNCVKVLPLLSRDKSWGSFKDYTFVLSPCGNGYDCHRTWETLMLGRIPIIESSPIDSLFDDLPVVILKAEDWGNITADFLQREKERILQNIKNNVYNMDKLTGDYWRKQILGERYIPPVVYMTWYTHDLLPCLNEAIDHNKKLNPNLEFKVYDDNECIEFISKNFDSEVVEAYKDFIPGAYKADLWRFCVLYIMGGIYIDIKFMCDNGFNFGRVLDGKEHFVGDFGDILQPAFISIHKGSNILKSAIDIIINKWKAKTYAKSPLHITGPGVIYQAYTMYKPIKNFDLWHKHEIGIYDNKNKTVLYRHPKYYEECKSYGLVRYNILYDQKKVYYSII